MTVVSLGHNNPPAETPLDEAKASVESLVHEARNWCDGEPVSSESQADELQKLLRLIQATNKKVDQSRQAQKKPHLDAGKAVDEAWKPLKSQLDLAAKTCKDVLAPWLHHLEDLKREREREAKEAADKAAAEAKAARDEAATSTDLATREEAVALTKAADAAAKAAKKASKDKAAAKGLGRAATLRTVRSAKLVDERALVAHYFKSDRARLVEVLLGWANAEVRTGREAPPGTEVKVTETVQ